VSSKCGECRAMVKQRDQSSAELTAAQAAADSACRPLDPGSCSGPSAPYVGGAVIGNVIP
ncbi:MAG: hypothetical protein WC881_09160, partial [Elusimicrobiota bacterium]